MHDGNEVKCQECVDAGLHEYRLWRRREFARHESKESPGTSSNSKYVQYRGVV